MPRPWSRRLLALLPRLGLATRPLAPDVTVVSAAGRPLRVEALDRRTWVVQRGGRPRRRRAVRRIGPPSLRTHLVVDERAAREGLPLQQMALSGYMADEHLAWLLAELDVNCVLDVGANTGQFGRRLRRAGYAGRIVSYEPLPSLVEGLRQRASGDPDWHVVPVGLGDEDTEAEMSVTAGSATTSSLLPVSDFGRSWSPWMQTVDRQRVRVRRLEDVYDEAVAGLDDPRVFLKMDTQGYDLKVFAGAGRRVHELVGLQSELACVPLYDGMPRMPEALATYEAAGFETSGVYPISRTKDRLRVVEFDVVMVRGGAVPRR